MTNTENLFHRIVGILIAQGVTTRHESAHWPVPQSDEEIYDALINEGVTISQIAKAFAEDKNKAIYNAKVDGDFDEAGTGWGIANNTLFVVNPYSHVMEELLDRRARGFVVFSKTGILEGSAPTSLDTNNDNTELDRSINQVISTALELGTSDIHIAPRTKKHLSIQFRVDGMLRPHRHTVKMEEYPEWTNKLLSKAGKMGGSPTEPLDLKFSFKWKDKDIQVRVAASPVTCEGDIYYYFVLRLLNPSGQLLKLEQIGFPRDEMATLDRLCRSPKGLIIITGPTGSGKTTTLYSLLMRIQELRPGDSLQTIEDPVEVELPGIHQTQINVESKMTFAKALRSKLRQDPDVILVGELRDKETVDLAIEASMTGHLVLTTLHTNSAALTISRLINMGVDKSTLADSLLAITAQRMVRNVCPDCSTEQEFGADKSASERYSTLRSAPQHGDLVRVHNLAGCSSCEGGYSGRSVVSELMIIDPWTQLAILEMRPSHEIESQHKTRNFLTMWDNGLQMVKAGKTTIAELESRLSSLSNYGNTFSYGREINLL